MARSIPDFELADALIRIDKAFGWRLGDHFDDEDNPWPISAETHRSYKKAHRRASVETIAALSSTYKSKGALLPQPPRRAGVWAQGAKWKALNNLDALSRRTEIRLSEQLSRVHNGPRARLLLGKLSRSRSDMMLIDAALKHISDTDKARLGDIFLDLAEACWDTGFLGVEITPVVIERLSASTLQDKTAKVRWLIRNIEDSVADSQPHQVAALEPLCMSIMEMKQAGAFIAHVTRLLESQSWRKEDSKVRMRYYRTWDETTANVIRHVNDRPIDLRCHDVGTVIELSKGQRLNEDQREWLASEMQESLHTIGISGPLIGKFRDLMFLAR